MTVGKEIHCVSPQFFFWQAWSPEARVELGCSALVLDGRMVFVDPIPLEKTLMKELTEQFPPQAIVLTNANHARHAAQLAAQLGIPRYAHREAAAEVDADLWLEDGDALFESLQVIELPGAAPGEIALHSGELELMVIGDALINLDSTGFSVLPAKYCADSRALADSLKKLLAFSFEMMTFAHGLPIAHQAKQRLASMLTS